jgi:hypothetical protein
MMDQRIDDRHEADRAIEVDERSQRGPVGSIIVSAFPF